MSVKISLISSLGVVSPLVHQVLAGDAGVGASYGGGVYPDSGIDAGLGVDGVPLFFLPWLSVL
jgi:hypothetical protein